MVQPNIYPALHVQTPDYAGSIMQGLAFGQQFQSNRLKNRMLEAEMGRQEELQGIRRRLFGGGGAPDPAGASGLPPEPSGGAASGGMDRSLFMEYAAMDPQGAKQMWDLVSSMDESKRAEMREQSEQLGAMAMGVLQAQPIEQPAMYQALVEEARRMGITRMPKTWSKEVLPWLGIQATKAMSMGEAIDFYEEEEAQYGEPQFDEGVGKWYQTNPKTGKREYTSPLTGMEVTTPDGTTIRTGVPTGGMEKKTRTDLEGKLLSTTESLGRLQGVLSDFRPEYQTLGTRGAEWFASLKEKTGLGDVTPEERDLMEKYTIYRRGGLDNINRTIKDMTGAQMSIQEAKRIRATMPDPGEGIWPTQGPTEFLSIMKGAVRDLRAAQARYAYALRNGLPTNPEELSRVVPLDRMEEIIQARADEIERGLDPSIPPDEAASMIAATVAREFSLPFGGQ